MDTSELLPDPYETAYATIRGIARDYTELVVNTPDLTQAIKHEAAKSARIDSRVVGGLLLGEQAVNGAEMLYDMMDQVDRETKLARNKLIELSTPIQSPFGDIGTFATALEIAAKGNNYTYVGSFNDTLVIVTPETTASEAVTGWQEERERV